MRRLAVIALLAVAATALDATLDALPAFAHFCAYAAQIPVGESRTISVGITVETQAVPDVTVTIPPGLRLDRVDPKAGWTVSRSGSTLRYRGGPIAPYTCEYFSLGVTAPAKGAFGIPVVQRNADGVVVARSTTDPAQKLNPYFEQVVYAGVKPPSPPAQGGGTSTTTLLGVALVGLGVVLVAVLGIRAWRARGYADEDEGSEHAPDDETDETADREAELDARVSAFKKQTRDRPGAR